MFWKEEASIRQISWPFLIWIFLSLVLAAIFITWNPIIRSAIHRLWPLLVATAFLLSYAGWGSLLGPVLARDKPPGIRFLTSAATGMGVTGLLIMFLGISGNLHRTPILLWIAGGLVFAVRLLWKKRSLASITLRGFWNILGAAVLAALLLSHLPYLVAPEVSQDALAYHLLVPRMYLGMGKLDRLPFLVESNYPLLAEFCYLPVLALSGEIASKCFHFLVSLLLFVCMTLFVKRIQGGNSGLMAPALFLSMPAVAVQTGWAWNDFFFTFFLLLSLYFLYDYHTASGQEKNARDLLSAGLLAGLAASTKYSFVLFLGPLVFLSLLGIQRWGWRKREMWKLFVPVAVVPGVWLLKNWIYTGNPVFPFFHTLFESAYWTDSLADHLQRSIQRSYVNESSWYGYLMFPFELVLKPRVVDIHTGILTLAFLPLLFGVKFPGRSFFVAFLLAVLVSWLFFRTGIRTVFLFFAVLTIYYSVSLHHRFSDRTWKRSVIAMIFTGGLMINVLLVFVNTYHIFDPFSYFIGGESERSYLSRVSPSQQAYDFLNSRSDSGNALLVSIHTPLYLRRPCFFSGRYDRPIAETVSLSAGNGEEMREILHGMKVTHVAINVDAYRREHEEGLYRWNDFRRRAFEDLLKEKCRQAGRWESDVVLECRFSES